MIAIKAIDNVEEFEILNDRICIGNKNEITVYDKFFNISNKVNVGVFYMVKFCSNIVIQPKENERDRVIIINENHNHRLLDNIILLKNYIDKDFIYILDSNHTIGKYDCKLNKIEEYKNIGRFPKIFFDNCYIRLSDNISCYTIQNNQTLWQHSFSDLLEGEKIVQVGDTIIYKDFLYLCLKDGKNEKNNATFCINIETGKVVSMYKGFYGFLFLEEDNIYTSYIYSVKKLSLILGEITEYNFENILKPKDLKIHWDKSIIKDNKLYFVDFKIYSTNRMGIIDMEKCELIWQKDFEINDGINDNIQEIRLVENRLYVHCSDNTLHIFEEEN